MAKSNTATAVFFLVFSTFLLSYAADTTTEASKREATTEVLPTAGPDVQLPKEALEANYIPVSVDQIHVDGRLREFKGGGVILEDRRPIHVRFFHTHRPFRLGIRDRTVDVVPPEWLGGRRMGAGFRFHRGHGRKCELMKRMMEMELKDDGPPMMHHHHLHHHDDEERKAGGGLAKWLRGFIEQF